MTRIRVEGLLAAFPKLIGTDKQHTYVETESVRYVYQPVESLYVLLVTNKQSNILEDLDTLRLLARLLPDHVDSVDEEGVATSSFEAIFAIDEVVAMGHKESVTQQQVRQFTAMESHEEKLHRMMIQSKVDETKDVMRKKAGEIDKAKVEKGSRAGQPYGGGYGGADMPVQPAGSGEQIGSAYTVDRSAPPTGERTAQTGQGRAGRKGMALGTSKKASSALENLKAEATSSSQMTAQQGIQPPASATRASEAAGAPPKEAVSVMVEETVRAELDRQGAVNSVEVQGNLLLEICKEAYSQISLQLELNTRRQEGGAGFQFKTHPNIDKATFTESERVALKDSNHKAFPVDSQQAVLKWRKQSKEESDAPLLLTCWPTPSGSETSVSVEYENNAHFDLHRLEIDIPVPNNANAAANVQIVSCDGEAKVDTKKNVLTWFVEIAERQHGTGSLEFVLPFNDADSFFPISASFHAIDTLCDLNVVQVSNDASDDSTVRFSQHKSLSSSYAIV